MTTYDPAKKPDPESWLALDEQARLDLIVEYHQRAGVELPDETMHAMMHAVVENQIAGEEGPVQATMGRLMRQGLNRHDAVHAIASVLAGHLHELMSSEQPAVDPNREYFQRLQKLTARRWLKGKS